MDLYTVSNGLAILGSDLTHLIEQLENQFTSWAANSAADKMHYPSLIPAADLDKFDYFRNFPHLGVVATHICDEHLETYAHGETPVESVPNDHLATSQYVLPSAACYSIYLAMRDQTLDAPRYVTTVAQCFRNEKEYVGLQRLWGFRMREIVCVGDKAAVLTHLQQYKQKICDFALAIDLPLTVETATDPFFDQSGKRVLMQQLFPTKEEFQFTDGTAIASVNFHRNFFGERCNIQLASGELAFTGCVAFGLERWLHALLAHFDGDVAAIMQRLETAKN